VNADPISALLAISIQQSSPSLHSLRKKNRTFFLRQTIIFGSFRKNTLMEVSGVLL